MVKKKKLKNKDFIFHGRNVTKLLIQKYKRLKKTGWVTLLNASVEGYMSINTEAIRVLIEDMGFKGIYITVNKPYPELLESFSKSGLDVSKLYFVDAISQTYGAPVKESKQCKYVFGPLNIEGIVSSVRDFIPSLGPKKKVFVFIDSITTVLLYNHLPRTIRFSKFLTKDLRKLKVNGIMVSVAVGMTSERLIKEVKQLCDEVIDIGNV